MPVVPFVAHALKLGRLLSANLNPGHQSSQKPASLDIEMGHLLVEGTRLSCEQAPQSNDSSASLPANLTVADCLLTATHIDTLIELHQSGKTDLNRVGRDCDDYVLNAIQLVCKHLLNNDLRSIPSAAHDENASGLTGEALTDLFKKLAAAGISPDGNPPGVSEGHRFIHSALFHAAHCSEPKRSELLKALANAGADPFSAQFYRVAESEDAFAIMPSESLECALTEFLGRQPITESEQQAFCNQLLGNALSRHDEALLKTLKSMPALALKPETLEPVWQRFLAQQGGQADLTKVTRLLQALPGTTPECVQWKNTQFTALASKLANSKNPEQLATLLTTAGSEHGLHLVEAEHIIIALINNRTARGKNGLIGTICEAIRANVPVDVNGSPVSADTLLARIKAHFNLNGSNVTRQLDRYLSGAGLALGTLFGVGAMGLLVARRLLPTAQDFPAQDASCLEEKALYSEVTANIYHEMRRRDDELEFLGDEQCLFVGYSKYYHDGMVDSERDPHPTGLPGGPFPEDSLKAVQACGSDLLAFLRQFPHMIDPGYLKTYEAVRQACLDVFRNHSLQRSLGRANVAMIALSGATLLSTAYSMSKTIHQFKQNRIQTIIANEVAANLGELSV